MSYTVTLADTTPPVTHSDAQASYTGTATINLTASDAGGVAHTYYRLDGGAQVEGMQITVAPPASGVATHTISFWSVDYSNNPETANNATFTVRAPNAPPVTTSNAKATYIGTATVSLTATDDSGLTPTTYYMLDTGVQTTGTVITVAPPAVGTATHTIWFWSVDNLGAKETTKSATFLVAAGDSSHTGTMTISTTDLNTPPIYLGGHAPDPNSPGGYLPYFRIVITYPDQTKATYYANSSGALSLTGGGAAVGPIVVPYGSYHIDAYSDNWTGSQLAADVSISSITPTYTHVFALDPGSG